MAPDELIKPWVIDLYLRKSVPTLVTLRALAPCILLCQHLRQICVNDNRYIFFDLSLEYDVCYCIKMLFVI